MGVVKNNFRNTKIIFSLVHDSVFSVAADILFSFCKAYKSLKKKKRKKGKKGKKDKRIRKQSKDKREEAERREKALLEEMLTH